MLNNYSIRFNNYCGLETLEPVSIEQECNQMSETDEMAIYVPFNENGIKKLAESKRGVYWRKDLKTDPNYEVDMKDSEEILSILAANGVPLFLVD